jgi:glycosyltransferase involved in cell wall biosynthesis
MKIAMLAPPWIEIPPTGYGGIEQVVALLAAELTERGNEVTLFAAPGTHSRAEVLSPLEGTHPDEIQMSVYEADHVASAFARMDETDPPFDVVHDHCGFTAFAFADRIATPLLHTLHGPFSSETAAFYARHADKACAVALSRYQAEQAPEGLEVVSVIGNPIVVRDFPFRSDKDDYMLWIGRFDDYKGAHRAIAVAREADAPLVLAGPVQPGQREYFAREVEPHLDGEQIRYIGEVGEAKGDLYAGARALLMPIRWAEPFGLVMTEAMACGTPVIAFPEGSAPELVLDGETGFVVDDEHEMAEAVGRLGEIDPARCRASMEERFDVTPVAAAYERAYEDVVTHSLTSLVKGGSLRAPPEESEWRI